MASDIKIFTSYKKGFKTIKGSFPIYIPNTDKNCNVEEQVTYEKVNIQESISENYFNALITQESDDVNIILLLVNVDFADTDTFYIQL